MASKTLTYNLSEQSKKTNDDDVYFYYSLQTISDWLKNNGVVPFSTLSAFLNVYGDIDTSSNRASMYVQVTGSDGSSYSSIGNSPYMVGGSNGKVYTGDISVTSWFENQTGNAGSPASSIGGSSAQLRVYMSLTVWLSFTWVTGGTLTFYYELPYVQITSVTGGTVEASMVEHGGTIKLTPTVPTGYTFSHWACSNGKTYTANSISVDDDIITAHLTNLTFTAVYTPIKYSVSVNTSPEGAGTVTGSGSYDYGSKITLTATASTGYKFVQWSDGVTSASRTITVTGDVTYTAYFVLDTINKIYAGSTLLTPYVSMTQIKEVYIGTTKEYG